MHFCDIELFGLFGTKEGRKKLKGYGALFTCLSSRVMRNETIASLNTDLFILYLRRFIDRRRNIRLQIMVERSDNGSNFLGACSEFKKAFAEMIQQKISDFMGDIGGEWILWKRNPPSASSTGEVS